MIVLLILPALLVKSDHNLIHGGAHTLSGVVPMEQLAIILCIYNFYTAKCCHCSVSMAWITGGMQPPSAVACLIIDVAQVTVYYAQYFQLKK